MKQQLTKEELQKMIICNNRLHTSVQPIERLKCFYYAVYIKYFSDKENGFIYNKLNANGSWSWRWFENKEDAISYMNGHTLKQISEKYK